MAITAQTIIDDVRRVLKDAGGTRWDDATLLRLLSKAQREIVRIRPSANPVRATFALTLNNSLQDITGAITDAAYILDVMRNVDAAGASTATANRSVTEVSLSFLDAIDRSWHFATAADEIDHWARHDRDPLKFFCYPRPNASKYVEMLYAKIPADIAAVGNNISLLDIYQYPLQLFTQAWSLLEDDPHAEDQLGAQFLNQAYGILGFGAGGDQEEGAQDGSS